MLTATPIPRTLQMSLIGIKDLSMIETPPKNRYPVQTYVTPRHDSIIKEAIERELLRGGQVFYLYNYTEDISDVMVKISKMVPEAKVCFAHGKMNKNQLEDIVSDFIDHKYDVLVSTTIIETGIDIPNANTLVIHDADKLGLSQLYQIRGRIGRSDRIAYAYLMYEARKILTPEAEKRLETIKEFTELGSGFKIAMRDLSIRGAGDLLGPEQSGFINSVGIDMYMQILEETLNELRSDKKEVKVKTSFGKNAISNRYIPENYVVDEKLKIEIHNKISSIENHQDLENIKAELIDRFGVLNDDLLVYMHEKLFYSLCNKLGVEKLDIKPKLVTITMTEEASQKANGEHLYKTAYSLSDNFLLSYHDRRINIAFKIGATDKKTWLILLCDYLSKVV
jgi:transcription-repair coupling factor (superfamily II helicase)